MPNGGFPALRALCRNVGSKSFQKKTSLEVIEVISLDLTWDGIPDVSGGYCCALFNYLFHAFLFGIIVKRGDETRKRRRVILPLESV